MNGTVLFKNFTFWVGLFVRVGLVLSVTPRLVENLYLPLLTEPSKWFVGSLGRLGDFPFGLPYVLGFGFPSWLGHAMSGDTGARLMFGAAVIAYDVILLVILQRICKRLSVSNQNLLPFYWLSPISLYVSYWHGAPHILSALLLIVTLVFILERKYRRSGGFFGAAFAGTPSMILLAPFLGLYFLGRSRLQKVAKPTFTTAAIVAGACLLTMMVYPGTQFLGVDAPEIKASLIASFSLSGGLRIYLVPMAYLVLLYIGWRVRYYNFDLLWTFLGVLLTGLSLLTPAAPGVVLWAVPFLAVHAMNTELTGRMIYWMFSLSFVGLHVLISSGATILGGYDLSQPLGGSIASGQALASALLTICVGSGALFVAQMLRRGVFRSYFYLSSRTPLAIGIGGDSGGGKDDLANSIIGMFGTSAVAHVSGDDYHRWDRQRSMWRALTHLNPKANDLEAFSRDVAELMSRRWVRARHYDHATGRMTKEFRILPREIVVASGLHALWVPTLTALYDVRIFLQMDESLRRFLKLRRDVRHRGHSPERVLQSLAQRLPDSERFIRPQARFADLIFRLEARNPSDLEDFEHDAAPNLLLVVQVPHEEDYSRLIRMLIALCDIQATEMMTESKVVIRVIGEPTRAEIAAVARRIIADDEVLASHPVWEEGLRGVMQLFVLDRIERARKQRMRMA